jgi:hypothetical protein
VNEEPIKGKPIRKLKPVQGEQPREPAPEPQEADARRVTIPAFSVEHILLDVTGDDVVQASVPQDEELEWSLERPQDGDWGTIVLEEGTLDGVTPFETDRFGLGWPHSFRRRF